MNTQGGGEQPKAMILTHWFGSSWPEWIDFFLISASANKDTNFLIITNQEVRESASDNISFLKIDFYSYREMISQRLGVDMRYITPYKLCDIRPALGYIHEDYLEEFPCYGFCDIDIIFGNLRDFVMSAVRGTTDITSAHGDRIAGHMCLLRNRDEVRQAFRLIPKWQDKFACSEQLALDEDGFYRAIRKRRWMRWPRYRPTLALLEQYSTVDAGLPWLDGRRSSPQRWFWHNGCLTNDEDGSRQFTYLHFMNWKGDRWRDVERLGPPPWPRLNRVVKVDWRQAIRDGFTISPDGIERHP